MPINLKLYLSLPLLGFMLVISSCGRVPNRMDNPSCFSTPSMVIDDSHDSPNCNQRISHLVMHYTVADFQKSLKILTDPSGPKPVSAHYLVPKLAIDGQRKVFNLVPDHKRAWHAGVSGWGKCTDLNDTSIGVEIVNAGCRNQSTSGNGEDWEPFNDYQMETVIALSKQIVEAYNIQPTNVVAHADVALPYGRKQDPGPVFDWEKLYKNGVGAFYDRSELNINEQANIDIAHFQDELKKYGYQGIVNTGFLDQNTREAISVFQMHFKALEAKMAQDGLVLTESQLAALEKRRNLQKLGEPHQCCPIKARK